MSQSSLCVENYFSIHDWGLIYIVCLYMSCVFDTFSTWKRKENKEKKNLCQIHSNWEEYCHRFKGNIHFIYFIFLKYTYQEANSLYNLAYHIHQSICIVLELKYNYVLVHSVHKAYIKISHNYPKSLINVFYLLKSSFNNFHLFYAPCSSLSWVLRKRPLIIGYHKINLEFSLLQCLTNLTKFFFFFSYLISSNFSSFMSFTNYFWNIYIAVQDSGKSSTSDQETRIITFYDVSWS